MSDLDLFCCAGGATTGIAMLGREVVGVDHDADACATHAAAGHPTIRADLTQPVPVSFQPELLWASPPCTAFSMAGKGEGREVSDVLIGRILAERWEPLGGYDAPVWLVLPTMREILRLAPEAVCMENVPPTLPVMHACAQVLERHGWHTAVGVLSAERFGVAQTRKRAFLIANRERTVQMPEPTHQGYGDEVDEAQGSLFGESLLPWVSMAEALGWGVSGQFVWKLRGNNSVAGGPLAERGATEPAMTVGSRTDLWKLRTNGMENDAQRDAEQPAPTVVFGHNAAAWGWERPSTTLVSSFRPDVVAGPGYRQAGDGPRQDAPGSISISISEAARLQAFPNGHPWQGSRTSIFRQAGNAVPPPVAAAVAGAALGVDWRPAVAGYLDSLYAEALQVQSCAQ